MPNKTLFFIVSLLFSVQSLFAQVYRPTEVKKYLSLTDKVHILPFFINTLEENWEEEEIEHYYNELLESQNWLIEQASNYNQYLEFDNERFDGDHMAQIDLDRVPRRKNPTQTIQTIMEELNYDDLDDLLDSYRFDLEKEKLKIVLFVKSNNRSHAYNYWSVKKMDLAIIYCRSTYGMMTDRYTIAHEILHQFSAWDLYYEVGKVQTKTSAQRAREEFPYSIMRSTRTKEKHLINIDAVTAWRIGWAMKQADFDEFDPVLNKEEIQAEGRRRILDRN